MKRNEKRLPFMREGETEKEWEIRFKSVNEQIAGEYEHIDFSNPYSFGKFEQDVKARNDSRRQEKDDSGLQVGQRSVS